MTRIQRQFLRGSSFQPASTCSIEGWGLVTAGVVAAGAIGSAVIQGNAAESAAQTQAGAAQNATNAELSMFNTTQNNLKPYMTSGVNNLNKLNSLIPSLTTPFSATQYQQSPGYAWQKSQGIDAIQNSASAAGGIAGGNTLKALQTYGTGLADQDYQQALQNYMQQQQQTYGMYSNLVNSGQSAAAGLGGIATTVGGQIGSNAIGAGNALAAGQIGVANAATGGINSLAQIANLYGNGGMSNPNNPNGVGGQTATYYTAAGQPYTGTVASNGFPSYCDYALKKNIEPYRFDAAAGLLVYSFRFKSESNKVKKHIGFIAQEVQEKYPDAISRGPRGFLMVDYSRVPTDEDWAALDKIAHEESY
jgi:Chaperone of endosialidase